MSGFVRRFTSIPTIEVIQQIEGLVIIDLAPPAPATGAGSGAVLLVGEFEDGLFATDAEAVGGVQVFGSKDFEAKFGAFGFSRGGLIAQDPCARRHLQENWNGNGYLKAFGLRAQQLHVARVDTSVGSVSFDPSASLTATSAGPYSCQVGDDFDITTDTGSGSSTAIAAATATVTGSAAAFATIVSGDAFSVQVDGGPIVTVTLGAADTTIGAVIARINATLGYTAASNATSQLKLDALLQGTASSLVLADVATGTLAKLGHTAGTTPGTGNVARLSAVTAAEIASIVNGSAAVVAAGAAADLDSSGRLRLYRNSSASTSTITVAGTSALATRTGITTGVVVGPDDHDGGTIPAGTRVTDAVTTWVTMQTLDVPAGEVGPYTVKVRPALDDGTALGAAAGDVDTILDPVPWARLTVNNAAAVGAALNEQQMDNAYGAALDATLDERGSVGFANYLLIARRSDNVVRLGRANAITSGERGIFPRIFITGDFLGVTANQAIANVAAFRSDRVFYTTKGWRVRVPQIAQLGVAGGVGFTADGIITVRPDGPLTSICATLAPEENPGQQTNLIDDFFEVDTNGETLSIETYEAFKAAGIIAPRSDRDAGSVYQSGVTSSLESGRTTCARRKMADFIQNSSVPIFKPFIKKLSTEARRDRAKSRWESFLEGLLSPENPELQRIAGFSVDDSENAGNTETNLARGIYFLVTKVRTLSSLDDIVIQTEIGENAVISTQV